jgi:hypothetical protein
MHVFKLFQRWYDMTTWQFNLFFLQQVIKYPITLSDVECVAHFVLSTLEADFKLEHINGLDLDLPTPFCYTHIGLFVV